MTVEVNGSPVGVLTVSQRGQDGEKGFFSLGRFRLPQGKRTRVSLSNKDTDGYVIADGVQLLKK